MATYGNKHAKLTTTSVDRTLERMRTEMPGQARDAAEAAMRASLPEGVTLTRNSRGGVDALIPPNNPDKVRATMLSTIAGALWRAMQGAARPGSAGRRRRRRAKRR